MHAQAELANFYQNKQDYANTFRWAKKLAEQGVAQAQFNLGLMYANGQGVKQDDTQAVYWYQKAAEQGVADAQVNLGLMYEKESRLD
ncbi:sel1 repeat family protein [Rodentibacter haemolyticus]|uniref:Sel1 repeat family protein n=1 Tax=Rodentibacter haemolyticus TaxID=2778911 RepID=A0ABX6V0Y0_9PAST|nr:sel1 repeat family protein [Rodentibacter haemolyticus]